MEDLLDSWPGTLLVVSHDRYFLERVTDQQYAILDGRLRHLPGGVDEYLRLRRAQPMGESGPRSATGDDDGGAQGGSALAGAERRAAQKELSAIERRFDKLGQSIASVHERLAVHDQADYTGLQRVTEELHEFEAELKGLEERWLELSDHLG